MSSRLFANTGALTRFILRRDRIRISIWLLSLTAITGLVAQTFTEMYPTAEERQAMAEAMLNPAMTAMVGPAYGSDNYTIGAMFAHEMLLFSAIAFGLMSILLVVRHTRADEEDGRTEMIRSLPTGRLSSLTATIAVVSSLNIIIAIVIGFSLYALGIESMGLEGSLLYGATLGAAGIIFTAVAAIFVQLLENARGAIGFSLTTLGVAYLIRAIGDIGNQGLSWFSPLGWILGTEVFVNNYWWPILLTIGTAVLLNILALYLNAIRDLGAGFIAAKPGREHASSLLQNPFGLLFRLQRTGLIAWTIGMFILGASYGSVLGDLESFFKDNEMFQLLLSSVDGHSLIEQFLPMLMSIMAMIGTIPAIMAINKMVGEEKKNRMEHLLCRAVSRMQVIASSLAISVLTSIVMLSVAIIGLWFAGSAVMEEDIAFSTFYGAGIVYFPAMLVMISVATLLVGGAPKLTSLSWGYLLYSFIVVYLGDLLGVPDWMNAISPFGHIPQIPVEELNVIKMGILLFVAVVFTVLGFIGYRRRDIKG